jgi:hypothetical protein
VRKWGALAGVVLGACVTESLSICVNCGGFRLNDMHGGFAIVLTARTGATLPCADLQVQMDTSITWNGCLSPQGGARDTVRGVIRLAFVDSTGATGALEFFDLQGGADSADASWRSTCNKLAPSGTDCPHGEGTARWTRSATAETAARVSAPPPRP